MEPRHGSDQKGARQESELGVEEAGWYNEIALFDPRIGNRNAIHLMEFIAFKKAVDTLTPVDATRMQLRNVWTQGNRMCARHGVSTLGCR